MDVSIEVHKQGGLRSAARHFCQAIAFYCVLATFGLVFLAWNVPAKFLFWLLPRPISTRVGQYAIMRGFRALLGLMRVTGLARFDLSAIDALREERGLVIAPNHPTLIDALLVISRLPRVVCITKASLWDNPALGAGARLAGYIRNDTASKLVRTAGGAVSQGSQLLIFPEGTRTTRRPIGPVKGGFAVVAQTAGVPVQTVLLEATPPYLGKGWGFLRKPSFPIQYRARLGRRFVVDQPSHRLCRQLESYFTMELGG